MVNPNDIPNQLKSHLLDWLVKVPFSWCCLGVPCWSFTSPRLYTWRYCRFILDAHDRSKTEIRDAIPKVLWKRFPLNGGSKLMVWNSHGFWKPQGFWNPQSRENYFQTIQPLKIILTTVNPFKNWWCVLYPEEGFGGSQFNIVISKWFWGVLN